MIYGSICSGIEAASVAWEPLGWRCAFLSEIDPFPRAVLAERYPEVPLHGDFTRIGAGDVGPIDALVGGTPCQSFSVAGLRGGLADERGNLSLEYLLLARRLRARWLVWENVPGVLSQDGGRAFGAILGGLVELGYGFAYRVLDAQHFGVPQRRRRVILVGYLGDWRPAAAVLFESASMRGDHPPVRGATPGAAVGSLCGTSPGGGWRVGTDEAAAGQLIAGSLKSAHGGADDNDARLRHLVAGPMCHNGKAAGSATQQDAAAGLLVAYGGNRSSGPIDVATAVNAHGGPHGRLDFDSETFITHTLRADGFDASEDGRGRGIPLVSPAVQNVADTLTANWHNSKGAKAGNQVGLVNPVIYSTGVRRLTPRECERLQGFPDDWTLINYRKRPAKDGPRYKAIGNSMAVPVMAWLGRRIERADQLVAIEAVA